MEHDIEDSRYFEIEDTKEFFGRSEKNLSKLIREKVKLFKPGQTRHLFSFAHKDKIKEILETGAPTVHGILSRNKPKKDHPLGSFHGVKAFRDTYKFATHHAQWGPILNIYDVAAYTISKTTANQYESISLENPSEGLIACVYIPIDEDVIPPRLYRFISKHKAS